MWGIVIHSTLLALLMGVYRMQWMCITVMDWWLCLPQHGQFAQVLTMEDKPAEPAEMMINRLTFISFINHP